MNEKQRLVRLKSWLTLVLLIGVVFGWGGCARSKLVGRVPAQTETDQISQQPMSLDGSVPEKGQQPSDGGIGMLLESEGEPSAALGKVCLDPGHPSFEDDRLYEAIINRKVTIYVKDLLEGAGYQVLVTTSDVTEEDLLSRDFDNEGSLEQSGFEVLSLEERAEACNAWNGDYLISIHHNRGFDVTRNVTSVYYGQDTQFQPWFEEAPIWAELTAKRLHEAMETKSKKFGGDQDQLGISLTVLEMADAVGILTEASFYSHPEERLRLNQNQYLKSEAKAIFDAFVEFMSDK
jgi:N-acetylmuramoyl-L-alanine amidase